MKKRNPKRNTARLNADIRAKKVALKDIRSECGFNRFYSTVYLDFEDCIVLKSQ